MSAYLHVSVHPKPGETMVTVAEPAELRCGPTEIVCLVMGQARIQFTNPADAQAWLHECGTLLAVKMAGCDCAEADLTPAHGIARPVGAA